MVVVISLIIIILIVIVIQIQIKLTMIIVVLIIVPQGSRLVAATPGQPPRARAWCAPPRSLRSVLLVRPISLLTLWIFEGWKHNLNSKGWYSQARMGFPGKFESSNVSRDNRSREIGRIT